MLEFEFESRSGLEFSGLDMHITFSGACAWWLSHGTPFLFLVFFCLFVWGCLFCFGFFFFFFGGGGGFLSNVFIYLFI